MSRVVRQVDATGKVWIRLGEAARILGVSKRTVAMWAADGRLPSSPTGGGQRVYDLDVVEALARDSFVEATWEPGLERKP